MAIKEDNGRQDFAEIMDDQDIKEIMEDSILRRKWKKGYYEDNGRLVITEIMENRILQR